MITLATLCSDALKTHGDPIIGLLLLVSGLTLFFAGKWVGKKQKRKENIKKENQ